jgi:hypothetical protein
LYLSTSSRFFSLALAKAIGLKAGVTKEKKQILDCLYDRELESLTTTNVSGTKLHVVAMHKLNMKVSGVYYVFTDVRIVTSEVISTLYAITDKYICVIC